MKPAIHNFNVLENILVEVSTSFAHTTHRQRANDLKRRHMELVMMKKERLQAVPGSIERAEARRKENQFKRRWRAETALKGGRKKKTTKPFLQLMVGDGATCDRTLWKEDVLQYFFKYTGHELVEDNIETVFRGIKMKFSVVGKMGQLTPF